MKRAPDPSPPSIAAPMIRLNVGGVYFDTTRDTLSKCQFFQPLIEDRIPFARDEDGRIFIDRNGKFCNFHMQAELF